MKQFIVLSLVILLNGITLQAQNTDSTTYKNSITIDVTALIKNVLNFSGNGISFSYPYLIEYRRMLGSDNVLRSGINTLISGTDLNQNDTMSSKQSNQWFRFGAGYERLVPISKRWKFYFGGDISYSFYNYNYTNTWHNTSTTSKTHGNWYSFSPLAGMIFNLNKRVSVSTEARLILSYAQQTLTHTNSHNSLGFQVEEARHYANFSPPTNIRFQFAF